MTSIAGIRETKGRVRLVTVTVVDYPTARWASAAGADIALVGDSLGMVVFGLPDTTKVTMNMMEEATKAAARAFREQRGKGARAPVLVADLPLEALDEPVATSRRLIEAGADAVKIECHAKGLPDLLAVREAGIEVMAHVGLMPQEIERLGGYKLQGRTPEAAQAIINTALAAEKAGSFSCVVEKVPSALGTALTKALAIPTIGIGAGSGCDGQVLVTYDILGMFERFHPKFVRRYAEFERDGIAALKRYAADVRDGSFPSEKESFE